MLSSRDILLLSAGAATATLIHFILLRRNNSTQNKSAINQSNPPVATKTTNTTIAVAKIKSGNTGFHHISSTKLITFVTNVFIHCGCIPNEAKEAANVLILADLRGIDSHGVARLMPYYKMLSNGIINPRPNVTIVRETPSTATVDGDNGLGLIVGPKGKV